MRRTALVGLLAVALLTPSSARAQLGVDFAGYSTTSTAPFTMGYFFDVVNPILVTGLGYFDDRKDGLFDNHQVGIWNSVGTLLASGTVSAGTGNTLNGWYRMVGIAPTLLTPGTGYVVGGETLITDPWIGTNFSSITGVTTHPDITVTAAAWYTGTGLNMPVNSHTSNPPSFYAGGNFETGAVTVTPEPASMVLMATGLLGVVGLARRRRTTV